MPADWQQLLGSSVISFLLSFMLMKSWLPFAPTRPGTVLLETRLGLIQRLLIHRTQAVLVLLYVLLGSLPLTEGHLFLPGTQPAALAGLAIVLMLPLRYVFTDRGVAINNGVPRTYKAFRRYDLKPGRRWLAGNTTVFLRPRIQPRGTAAPLTLFIPTAEVAAVTRVLKRHLR